MKEENVISRNPDVVIAGTRVSVQVLINCLTEGKTLDRFLEGFPTVRSAQAATYPEMTLEDDS